MNEIGVAKTIMLIFLFYELMILLASGFLGSLPIQNTSSISTFTSLSSAVSNTTTAISEAFPSKSNPNPYVDITGTFSFLGAFINWIVGFIIFFADVVVLIFFALGILVYMLTGFVPSILNAYHLTFLSVILNLVDIVVAVVLGMWLFKWIVDKIKGLI